MKIVWKWLHNKDYDLAWELYCQFEDRGPDVSILKILTLRVVNLLLKLEPRPKPAVGDGDEIPF
jgi:hypothetical protein